ncbi:EKC/KEOPS complex subunit BUD32 [Dictyocoela muelleri]|nr:EKC/KEOPS complex subunit BUD32 [Dictyocoela muelleri]
MKLLYQGAEAKLYIFNDYIIKERLQKGYRLKELDEKISLSRTKNEIKMLKFLKDIINVPHVIDKNIDVYDKNINWKKTIVMKRIDGIVVKDIVAKYINVLVEVGRVVRNMHDNDVIHGDLTTSNFIFAFKNMLSVDNEFIEDIHDFNNKIYVIDFGLSFRSSKIEDKAVDLYVLEKSIICAHGDEYVDYFYKGYGDNKDVLERLKQVRYRGRKKSMVG